MEIVSSKTDKEIETERAAAGVRWALRELAANIIRVRRGAGKSYKIGRDCVDLINAMDSYREVVGHYPSSDHLDDMLQDDSTGEEREGRERSDRDYARDEIIAGALQIEASRLLFQRTQVAAGRSQLHYGLTELERINEREREEAAKAARAAIANRATPPKKTTRTKGS